MNIGRKFNIISVIKRIFKSTLIALLVFCIVSLIFPINDKVEYAPIVYSKEGKPLYAWLTKDEQWRMFAELPSITPEIIKSFIYKEDKRFYYHPGVDPIALGRAFVKNIIGNSRTSGASTITMQVARMLDRKPRTYINKFIEIFRAFQLELKYSKDEILQLYLNLVPMGYNIQGVKAAALIYFEKSPDQLSLAEITALTIIPNKPNQLKVGIHNNEIQKQRNHWLKKFNSSNLFNSEIIESALDEPLIATRKSLPTFCPQLAWRLRRKYPSLHSIPSTIQYKLQEKCQSIASNYVYQLNIQGIYNAAVIIIDNKTKEVVSYVGSTDYKDTEHQGQVDGVMAKRSPGSTLKPFLYGVGFDKGIYTPKTKVVDIPININGYMPENYDLNFRGWISIEDALKNSLNIPAVNALHELGLATFIQQLKMGGITTLQPKKIGLSMILGACDIRLDQLSNLYSCLANQGIDQPLKWITNNNEKLTKTRIFSKEATYMLQEILKDLTRPDLPNFSSQAMHVPKISWKTGTSYAHKDAWSIGFNNQFTIGVWIGNFNGKSAPTLNGATTATPLLFQLFNRLSSYSNSQWEPIQNDLGVRLVCSHTGNLPNHFCNDLIESTYIPGISSNKICNHLKQMYVSADKKISYCTSCLPSKDFIELYVDNLPLDLQQYYSNKHIFYNKPPTHNPNCERVLDGLSPKITSLKDELTYIMLNEDQPLNLSCNADIDVNKVFWYINDVLLSSGDKTEVLTFIPKSSKIKITCVDDKGRSTTIRINVKR